MQFIIKYINNKNLALILILLGSFQLQAQKSLSKLLKKYNQNSVAYVSVEEFKVMHENATILDAREPNEFKTSHIQNATCVGYDNFDLQAVLSEYPDKTKTIIVYCSLGIRSEDIGEQLLKAGYTNVYNLYGGIFEWKNKNNEVYNTISTTDSVHVFSKEWAKWLNNGIKVYD